MSKKNKNKEKKNESGENGEFTLKDYFYINLIFWAFLGVLSIVVFFSTGGKWDPVIKNVFGFIFLVFGGGFTAVSVFDLVYERIAKKNENKA